MKVEVFDEEGKPPARKLHMGSFRIDIAALALGGSGWLPRPAETALQDLTFEPLDRPCVLSARSPELSGRSADGP